MMGLSDGRKSFWIGLAILIQYRSVTASHVAVAITLYAIASSLKIIFVGQGVGIQKAHNRETLKFDTELYIKPSLLVRSNVWSTNMRPGCGIVRINLAGCRTRH